MASAKVICLTKSRVPPGARYDPAGPFQNPPRGNTGRRGGGFGGASPNPFGDFGAGDFI